MHGERIVGVIAREHARQVAVVAEDGHVDEAGARIQLVHELEREVHIAVVVIHPSVWLGRSAQNCKKNKMKPLLLLHIILS